MKRVLVGIGILLVAAIVVNFVAGLRSQDDWAFDAARAEMDRRGLQDAELVRINSTISHGLFGNAAVVAVEVKEGGATRRVRITLRKPIHLMDWRVTEYHEE